VSGPTFRYRGDVMPDETIRASMLTPDLEPGATTADLELYDPIDSWGGWWGVSAKEFSAALAALPDTVTTINLRINSPGGEVWDAMAIVNMLQRHKARIVAWVDGVAASAASVLAVTADECVMGTGAQMMLHDAWIIELGDADTLRATADRLDKSSGSLAKLYAAKAGGTVDEWRAVMTAGPNRETWYTADEAVAAGLADRVAGDVPDAAKARARAMLAAMPGIGYRGRDEAPAPVITPRPKAPLESVRNISLPVDSDPGHHNTEPEGDSMSTLTDGLRQRLGISDAQIDEDGLLAALDEALNERSEPTNTAPPAGTVLVDAAALEALKTDAAAGREALDRQHADDRVRAVDAAIAAGQITPARRADWLDALTKDPGAAATLASLPKGLVPTQELGSAGALETNDEDALYAGLFGKES